MRLGKGKEVEIVNGRGDLGLGSLLEVSKKNASIEILSTTFHEEATPRILLAIPFMRVSKLEWIVEKRNKLGASAFLFYPATHSEKDDFSPTPTGAAPPYRSRPQAIGPPLPAIDRGPS